MRTHYCGSIGEGDVAHRVTICGWVKSTRDMGGVIFVDVHDREGTVQVVFDSSALTDPDDFAVAEHSHSQSVVSVTGTVRHRGAETYNNKLKTGTVEIAAESLDVLSDCGRLPFDPHNAELVKEDVRLKYRYIDLRRESQLDKLKFRHRILKAARDYLDGDDFIEVETPCLTKSTPEGARDYIVPSRTDNGAFYALPQSPQIFKQLLMVGGVDKYYQVARCFRDEDLRADRQPEFTQLDVEMSFVTQEDVLVCIEKLIKSIFEKTLPDYTLPVHFPRMTWTEAMDKYGSDKPDLRFDMPITDITETASACGFSVFESVCENGGVVRAITVKGKADFTRGEIESLTRSAESLGARGMAWIALKSDGEIYSVLTKFIGDASMAKIIAETDAAPGDFILFCADKIDTARRVTGSLRLELADMLSLKDAQKFEFVLITGFPQFEYSEAENRFKAAHHPFTMPYESDIPLLLTNPEKVRAQAYDIALNGVEIGGGSVRIHNPDVQKMMFAALGFSDAETEEKFGFMVNAFKFGTPPHAGFALGVDRLVMILTGAKSLREVIAFPKLGDSSCPMTHAPSAVEDAHLDLLGLALARADSETQAKQKEKAKMNTKKSVVQINVNEISRLSLLAEKDADEAERIRENLAKIVSFAEEMNELPPLEIELSLQSDVENIFREDTAEITFTRNELLSCAPETENGYIKVPRAID